MSHDEGVTQDQSNRGGSVPVDDVAEGPVGHGWLVWTDANLAHGTLSLGLRLQSRPRPD